jgi:small GTP-binding protein
VPEAISKLSNLEELDLNSNQLSTVPESIAKLTHLNWLYLSSNQLTTVPEAITKLTHLNRLDLRSNQLSTVPEAITNLSNLKTLYLSSNQLSTVPEAIAKLSNLKELDLSSNQLTTVPEAISNLTNLKELYLRGNQLSTVPEAISNLTNLNVLYLSSNQLSTVPDSITNLTNLNVLYLSSNQLSTVPEAITNLTNLNRLDLRSNQLSTVPEAITNLTNLKTLDLRSNQLSTVPEAITNLTHLKTLDLRSNQLSTVPEAIAKLTNLNRLDLSSNQLTTVPEAITNLSNLKTLYLSSNQLSTVPEAITNLSNLKTLYLSSNQLSTVPEAISNLTNLKELDLSSNQLSTVPEAISKLSNLNRLYLRDNPLTSPPLEVANRGIGAIRQYFAELDSQSQILNEVKVLLVGEGSAGKTSLVKRVLGDAFDPNEPTTHGIRITDWPVHTAHKTIKVNIWDFGGQEIMHATHQFFLSKRSLYVLVLDGRRDERPEYWLRHIQSFGGDSPILIVLNKYDANPSFDLNRPFLQQKYPSICGFYRTSCQDGYGIPEFKAALEQQLSQVKLIETRWANSWFQVKQQLEHLDEHYISYDQYEKICHQAHITEALSQDVLVDFLHDLGVIVHFRGEFGLEDTQVLEPKWITSGVYRIINSPQVAENNGILHLRDLKSILQQQIPDDYFYPRSKYKYILGLMKKFELCYDLDPETVLIPQLLNVVEPNFNFDYQTSLKFVLHYGDFMPRSIMPRFIVKRHPDILGDLRWRTGVVLQNRAFQSTAVIKADTESNRIYIDVNGNQKKDYLAVILLFFREINNSFEKLNVSERIRMPDNPDLTMSYANLLDLVQNGMYKCLPEGSKKPYDIRELLGLIQLEPGEDLQKILDLVLELRQDIKSQGEDEKALIKRANQILSYSPSLFGLTINVDNLVEMIVMRLQRSKSPKD